MNGNQRDSFRIGDDGIVLHGDKFSKVIYYEDVDGDLEVKAVYKISNYDYNIHDKDVNIMDTIIRMERNEFDEELTETILRDYQLQYGTLFQKYNPQTGRYSKYPRGNFKNTPVNKNQSNGAGTSGGAQQTGGVKFQSRDSDYLSAVERGDMETAQKMVDEAAKAAGYTIKAYHGTNKDFTVFDRNRIGSNYYYSGNAEHGGFFFTDKKSSAKYYSGQHAGQEGARVIDAYLKFDNPYFEYAEDYYGAVDKYDLNYIEWYDYVAEQANDGIIVKSPYGNLYIPLTSEQIKSANPVTYDDNGNVIPLSQRFDTEKSDIRHQSRESVDNELSADEIREQEREKWEAREKELRAYFKEQRAKNVRQRNTTKLRNSVAKKFRSLDKKLNRSDKDKTVKVHHGTDAATVTTDKNNMTKGALLRERLFNMLFI